MTTEKKRKGFALALGNALSALPPAPDAQTNVYSFPSGFGFGTQLHFYRSEKDNAVNIANKYLNISPERTKTYEQYLLKLFNLWKLEHGKPRSAWTYKNPLIGTAGVEITEDERFEQIQPLKPWEAAPFYITSPLNLFHHIASQKYEEFPDEGYGFLLAHAILLSDKENNPSFWPEMIKESLWLSLQLVEICEDVYKKEAVRLGTEKFNRRNKMSPILKKNKKAAAEKKAQEIHKIINDIIEGPTTQAGQTVRRFGKSQIAAIVKCRCEKSGIKIGRTRLYELLKENELYRSQI